MKSAAVFIFISLVLASQTFAVLRPLFPVKPEPPLRGGAIIIGDEISGRRNHFVNGLVLPTNGLGAWPRVKQHEALTAGLQKLSAQIEVTKPAPQIVVNDQ
jgi:hypothetical protein